MSSADAMVTAIQPLIGLALIILSTITVDPLGRSGRGLLGVVLLAMCSAFMLSRAVPDSVIEDSARLAIAVVGAISSGMLFGFDPNSWGISFAITVAVHAGIRFESRVAVTLAAVISVTATVTIAVFEPAHVPWWIGMSAGLAVVVGLLRRNRAETLRAAHELIEQTQLAALFDARATVLAERARVARDIHDVLAHSLSGVNMQLSMADALFDAGQPDEGREAMRRAQAMVVTGLGEARRAVSTLRDDTIDLEPSLRAMLNGDEHLVVVGEPATLDTARTQTLVRAAQEALTNARRHAPGAEVVLTLSYPGAESEVVLEVVNAASTAAPSGDGGGFGLVGMQERAALVGGAVTAGPTPDGGWQTRVSLPVGTVEA